MKSNIIIVKYALIFILFMSCSYSDKIILQNNANLLTLKVNTSIELRNDIRLIIDSCLERYPQDNVFLLSRSPRKINSDTDELISNDFLIGPAFELSNHEKVPLLYFEYRKKKIFIKCGIEELYTDSQYQDSIFHSQLIRINTDSIVNTANEIIKNGAELYVYRSTYFKINKDGSLYKSYSPDTLLLPKPLPSTVKFEPPRFLKE